MKSVIESSDRRRVRQQSTERAGIVRRVMRDKGAFALAGAFIVAAFCFGGGARADIVSLVILRPLAVLVIGWSLYNLRPGALRAAGIPLLLLGALAVWTALQLVPLPHSIWLALPGRELVAANDAVVGVGAIARPLTLSQSLTTNTLFSLLVPFAALFAFANLGREKMLRIRYFVFAMAALAGLLGILQLLGPPDGPLYFYRITNPGTAVGLFSNRNHFAIFLASLLPLCVHQIGLVWRDRSAFRPARIAVSVTGMTAAVIVVLATGSRAGALLLLAAMGASGIIWYVSKAGRVARAGLSTKYLGMVGGALAAGLGAMIFALSFAGRNTGIDRLFGETLDKDLRVQLLPHLWKMVWEYFPTGSGMGTFPAAYQTGEPLALLGLNYLNQAHADYLQILIEGGIIGGLIVVASVIWLVLCGIRAFRLSLTDRTPTIAVYAWLAFAILLAGSIGDYPLRTPSLMIYAVLLCYLVRDHPPGEEPAMSRR